MVARGPPKLERERGPNERKSAQREASGPRPAGQLTLAGWPAEVFSLTLPQNDVVLGVEFLFFLCCGKWSRLGF